MTVQGPPDDYIDQLKRAVFIHMSERIDDALTGAKVAKTTFEVFPLPEPGVITEEYREGLTD